MNGFTMAHTNINVLDLERSIRFYEQALGLKVMSRKKAADGAFEIAFLSDGNSSCALELTWLREKTTPYALGDNEGHICFRARDYAAAHEKHQQMGCICFENDSMGLYFIEDPDGYWMEITPEK